MTRGLALLNKLLTDHRKSKSDLLRFLDIQLIFSVELWPERIFSKLGFVLRGAELKLASFADKKYSHVNMSAGVLNFETKSEDCHNIYTTAHTDCPITFHELIFSDVLIIKLICPLTRTYKADLICMKLQSGTTVLRKLLKTGLLLANRWFV